MAECFFRLEREAVFSRQELRSSHRHKKRCALAGSALSRKVSAHSGVRCVMTWSRGAVPQAGPERAHEQLAVSVVALSAAKITERGGAVIGVGLYSGIPC